MVISTQLKLINLSLQEKSVEGIKTHGITPSDFGVYQPIAEFILEHNQKFGKPPTKHTVAQKFPEFQIEQVDETIDEVIDEFKENNNFLALKQIVNEAVELAKKDSFEATTHILNELKHLQTSTTIKTVDIIQQAKTRLDVTVNKATSDKPSFISTGLQQLDDMIGGYQKGEEFVVVVARTSEGKSFYLVKTMMEAWKDSYRVGFISPEMTSTKIGYRFDSLYKNFSNQELIRGTTDIAYKNYIDELSTNNVPFFVSTPLDFGKAITVSKLRSFCIENKIDILGIDGITYLADERAHRGDSKTIKLTNISEDLMELSMELGIPIVVVVQANRGAIKESGDGDAPELEHIRDSDGISHNATKVIALKKRGNALEIAVRKNRDGENGGIVSYEFYPDQGIYRYLPDLKDSVRTEDRQEYLTQLAEQFTDPMPF